MVSKKLEKDALNDFLSHFNPKHNTNFVDLDVEEVKKIFPEYHGESPDFVIMDNGNKEYLGAELTELTKNNKDNPVRISSNEEVLENKLRDILQQKKIDLHILFNENISLKIVKPLMEYCQKLESNIIDGTYLLPPYGNQILDKLIRLMLKLKGQGGVFFEFYELSDVGSVLWNRIEQKTLKLQKYINLTAILIIYANRFDNFLLIDGYKKYKVEQNQFVANKIKELNSVRNFDKIFLFDKFESKEIFQIV